MGEGGWKRCQAVVLCWLALLAGVVGGDAADASRETLERFYRQMGGTQWYESSGWMQGDPCKDSWLGVTCDDDQAGVLGLSLVANNVRGEWTAGILPDELVECDLRVNGIRGTLPSSLGSHPSLRSILLDDNMLAGSIPDSLSRLERVGLASNFLSGSMPAWAVRHSGVRFGGNCFEGPGGGGRIGCDKLQLSRAPNPARMPLLQPVATPPADARTALNALKVLANVTATATPTPTPSPESQNGGEYDEGGLMVGLYGAVFFVGLIFAAAVELAIGAFNMLNPTVARVHHRPASRLYATYVQWIGIGAFFPVLPETLLEWSQGASWAIPLYPFGISLPWKLDASEYDDVFIDHNQILLCNSLLWMAVVSVVVLTVAPTVRLLVTSLSRRRRTWLESSASLDESAAAIDSDGSTGIQPVETIPEDTTRLLDSSIGDSYGSTLAPMSTKTLTVNSEPDQDDSLREFVSRTCCGPRLSLWFSAVHDWGEALVTAFYLPVAILSGFVLDAALSSVQVPSGLVAIAAIFYTAAILLWITLLFCGLAKRFLRFWPFTEIPLERARAVGRVYLFLFVLGTIVAVIYDNENWFYTMWIAVSVLLAIAIRLQKKDTSRRVDRRMEVVVYVTLVVRSLLMYLASVMSSYWEELAGAYVVMAWDGLTLTFLGFMPLTDIALRIIRGPDYPEDEKPAPSSERLYGAAVMDPEEAATYLGSNKAIVADATTKSGIRLIPWEEIKIKAKVGRGAGGVVWSASWGHKEVAIKVLFGTDECDDPESLKEDLLEVKMLMNLVHPNIVEFCGLSVNDGDVCIVLELMQFGSLATVISNLGTKLALDVRLNLLIDAARGIAYMHNHSVIHRDIKPHNLLVNSEWVCKVADFGISTMKTKTKTMTAVGTPVYMAPEVLNHARYGMAADVYSFGVVVAEVLSLRRPYSEHSTLNEVQLMFKIYHDRLRPSLEGVPDRFVELLDRALSHDADVRPTMQEMADQLEALRQP